MKFGEIFARSWEDYKNNFKAIFLLVFWFLCAPNLIFSAIQYIWAFNDEAVYQLLFNPLKINQEPFQYPWNFFTFNIVIGVVTFLLTLFVLCAITSLAVKKSKFSFIELVNSGKNGYLKYFGLTFVYLLFVSGLLLLLVIPGIIFFIYWIFSGYVLFDENKKIRESLKRSKEIVKGKWWRVFGYFLDFYYL